MWNICPIDSREACLSVPKAHRLHCHPSFTVELFILVSRASQLTHWGALCWESSPSGCAHGRVCVLTRVCACMCLPEERGCVCARVCVHWFVRCLCACMHSGSEKERMGHKHWQNEGKDVKWMRVRRRSFVEGGGTVRRNSCTDRRFIACHVRNTSFVLFACLTTGTDRRLGKSV